MTDQKTYLHELGQRICVHRKEAGLTQTEFGKLVGLSQQVIADYEAGNRNIPIYTLARISEVLGMEVGEFTTTDQVGQRKRGPTPKLQRQIEKINSLPREQQKSILQVLDMALKSA